MFWKCSILRWFVLFRKELNLSSTQVGLKILDNSRSESDLRSADNSEPGDADDSCLIVLEGEEDVDVDGRVGHVRLDAPPIW